MNNQKFINILTSFKTSWEYILILAILVFFVGEGFLACQALGGQKQKAQGTEFLKIQKSEEVKFSEIDLIKKWEGNLGIREGEKVMQMEIGDVDNDKKLELVVRTRLLHPGLLHPEQTHYLYVFKWENNRFVKKWEKEFSLWFELSLGNIFRANKEIYVFCPDIWRKRYTPIETYTYDGGEYVLTRKEKINIQIDRAIIADVDSDGNDELIVTEVSLNDKFDYSWMGKEWREGEPCYYHRVQILSWEDDKFICLWKSDVKNWPSPIQEIIIGDFNNNKKKDFCFLELASYSGASHLFEMDNNMLNEIEDEFLEDFSYVWKSDDDIDKACESESVEGFTIDDYDEDGKEEVICWMDITRGILGRKYASGAQNLLNVSKCDGLQILEWNRDKNNLEGVFKKELFCKSQPPGGGYIIPKINKTISPKLEDIDGDKVKELICAGNEGNLILFEFVKK